MLGWILVIVLVVAIFNADKLPELRKTLEAKTQEGLEAVKKGQKIAQEKIAQVKEKAKKENKETAKKEDEPNQESETTEE
ncbi:MAG: hypothetical protein IJW75_00510 [Alphaproteobacteria bacterium]|nr:hypothetical protein [Alphaproteobacteria bacterium]